MSDTGDKKTRYPGVYYRERKDGSRAYRVAVKGPDGRPKKVTVPGGVLQAAAIAGEAKAKQRRGDHIIIASATVAEVADEWFKTQTHLRSRTRDIYDRAIRKTIIPALGKRKLAHIDADAIAAQVRKMQRDGKSASTIRNNLLVPLGRIFKYAMRRGYVQSNPVALLDRSERPKTIKRPIRVLTEDEIRRLISAAPDRYRLIVELALFAGLRLGEILGLTWADVDLKTGLVRVQYQLNRDGQRVPPKTPGAVRDVLLKADVGKRLAAARLASAHSADTDLVFCTPNGSGLDHRNVRSRGFYKALEAAGLKREGERFTFHDLRHVYATMMRGAGADIVFLSRQLGHANPQITLNVYSHAWREMDEADKTRAVLDAFAV